jgi:2-polyprenyl-6-methoxyphenol hydroxylase-like FAD-dependent oxidoreductase
MSGVVYNTIADSERGIALAGDSAHAYPPSGGFGMNTGIGDAFSLSFKIKNSLNNLTMKHELDLYNQERFVANKGTLDLAMLNYEKSVKIAYKLGLDLKVLEFMKGTL